jgi:kanosamine 6-kinase
VTAVGVAMPATVDPAGVVTAWPNRPGWVGAHLGTLFGAAFPGVPVRFADDGDLAAAAEAGAAGCADLLYLGVGTGIGGGIVSGGRLWPGPARGSCELGHLIVDRSGPPCRCGRRGCVQAVASGPAVLARAAALLGRELSSADLVAAYTAGEGWAATCVHEGADALAAAVVGVAELAHPSLVLVGGGFAAALPGYVDEVAGRVAELTTAGRPAVPVRPAALGGRSSLHGAVLLAANPRLGGGDQEAVGGS